MFKRSIQSVRRTIWHVAKWPVIAAVVIGALVLNGVLLSPRDELVAADAVVAISGGDTAKRTLVASDIYKKGWAQKVIFSGAAEQKDVITNAGAMKNIAIDSGVPERAITLSENAENTNQNAQEVADILSETNASKIILVTSQYHQKRATDDFAYELARAGLDIEIINYPANEDGWSRIGWWTNLRGIWLTTGENVKITTNNISRLLDNDD